MLQSGVARRYASRGSDLHPAQLPAFELPHSLADPFCFLFSPFLHPTPFTAPCYPSPAPNSRRALSRTAAVSHWLARPSIVWPFRTEATGASDLQRPPQSNQEALPRQRDSSQAPPTPTPVWSCSFQRDLACHSDYAFWLIFYEARLSGKPWSPRRGLQAFKGH